MLKTIIAAAAVTIVCVAAPTPSSAVEFGVGPGGVYVGPSHHRHHHHHWRHRYYDSYNRYRIAVS